MHHHVVPVKERLLVLPSILTLRLNCVVVHIVILEVGLGEGRVLLAGSHCLLRGLDGSHVA